jgi:hypothetical protein
VANGKQSCQGQQDRDLHSNDNTIGSSSPFYHYIKCKRQKALFFKSFNFFVAYYSGYCLQIISIRRASGKPAVETLRNYQAAPGELGSDISSKSFSGALFPH